MSNRSLRFAVPAAILLIVACGGTVTDVNGRNGKLSGAGGANGGGPPESGGTDPFQFPGPQQSSGGTGGGIGGGWHSEPAAGGALPVGSGGSGPGGTYAMGGSAGKAGAPIGGYAGFAIDAGPPGAGGSAIYVPISPTCGYSFGSMEWKDSCAPTGGCLNLDPSTWSPVAFSTGADAGALGGSSVEAPFCQPPVPGQTYSFAFDEQVQDRNYTSFNVATGSVACEGYGIAYLGYPGDGTQPGTVRTQCFSVDGRFLQSRLAVTYYGTHFSNLRVVSSCPCTRQIPYNTETCPPPNGSAGAPSCN